MKAAKIVMAVAGAALLISAAVVALANRPAGPELPPEVRADCQV